MDYRGAADLRMSPFTGNKLSHRSLQSHVYFWLIFGWWYITEMWVFFVSHIRAVCFISWHSVRIGTPTAHRSVTSRLVSDMCCFVIISISDLFTLWLHNRKKPEELMFFEEEIAALQTPCLKADECSKSMTKKSNNWQWNMHHYAPTVHQKRDCFAW